MVQSAAGTPVRLNTNGERIQERNSLRTKRRIMVRFGQDIPNRTGFTRNISETGLFIQTQYVFRPGTTIQIQMHFAERVISQWARVRWAKKVPPQLSHLLDCGMGVQFLNPDDEWIGFWREWKATAGVE